MNEMPLLIKILGSICILLTIAVLLSGVEWIARLCCYLGWHRTFYYEFSGSVLVEGIPISCICRYQKYPRTP